jgi:hypothetical protein
MLANVDRRRRSRDGRGASSDTHFLLRGLTRSQFLQSANIVSSAGLGWRPLEWTESPEIGGDSKWQEGKEGLCGSGVPEEWVRRATTAGEALLLALHAAVKATAATAGLLHRVREPFIGLVTSSAHGPAGTEAELGQVISRHDAALASAQRRTLVFGSKDDGDAARAIAGRFAACGADLAAVAMVPIFDGDTLMAMLEIGRVHHGFRWSDAEVLKTIAALVCSR